MPRYWAASLTLKSLFGGRSLLSIWLSNLFVPNLPPRGGITGRKAPQSCNTIKLNEFTLRLFVRGVGTYRFIGTRSLGPIDGLRASVGFYTLDLYLTLFGNLLEDSPYVTGSFTQSLANIFNCPLTPPRM